MGQEDVVEPPKKKLKQAQLSFCSTPVHLKTKIGQKRKLNETGENGVQHFKIVRTENAPEGGQKKGALNEIVSLIDDSSNEPETKNDVNNFNKTECEPSAEGNKENLIFSGQDVVSSSLTEEASLSLRLDIDSQSFVPKDDDQISDIITDKPEMMRKDTNDAEKEMSSIDPEDDSNQTEDKKDVSSVADTSMRTNTDSDNDAPEFETTPPAKQNESPKTPKRRLTPKQLLKKAESEKKRQEKERTKQEKKNERAKEKEERLKKLAEKKDEKRREKEEKEKKRLAELNQKTEEKRIKEEERRKKEEAKEEEKKKKEEAKLIVERKNSQARAAFESFFVPRKSNVTPEKVEHEEVKEVVAKFMPFPVKQDMRLADVTRTTLNEEDKKKLDELFCVSDRISDRVGGESYLRELKSGKHRPKSSEGTWPLSAWQEEQHDVIIVESVGDEVDEKVCTEGQDVKKTCYRAKLLQFHDNRRPPYWGTWRKRSKNISSRRPLSRDNEFFDYEVDSDSEWEDEEEGESLEGGDDADKEQSDEEEGDGGENGYLLDNTFVPHGYLSDEEAQAKDEDISPEEQKLRMILLKEEFDEEMNQKAERLKPRLLGCVWISNETTEVSSGSLYEKLLMYRAVWDESSGPINLSTVNGDSPSPPSIPKKPFPQSVVEPLVKFVHGSQLSLSKLVKEFLTQLEKENPTQYVTKGAVTRKIKDIAKRSYDCNGKQAWAVNADFCSEFGLKSISGATTPSNPSSASSPVLPKKSQEGTLVSFLKGETPKNTQKEATKKRAQLITLSKVPSGGVIDLTEDAEQTPKPNEVVKKRVALITLSRTPDASKCSNAKHKDTPRPAYNPFSHFMKTTPKESVSGPSDESENN